MRIREGLKYDFKDLLLVPQRSSLSSRANAEVTRTFTFPHSKYEINCIPLIASNMAAVGTFAMAKALAKHKILTALHKHYSVEELVDFFYENQDIWQYVFYTVGISNEDYNKLFTVRKALAERIAKSNSNEKYHDTMKHFPNLLCIDIANGYTESFVNTIKDYRATKSPMSIILAGNIVTPNIAEELILSGADIVKVGIGSGSVCTTRIKTGVGYPQMSAISECSFAVHGKPDGHICSDGGCTTAGDVAKAFAAGADFVMLGGMLSGTEECEGEWEYIGPPEHGMKKSLKFFGMSSKDAQLQFNGGLAKHRAAEGKTVSVAYKGLVEDTIQDILGGIRSACTYVGAKRIKDLPKCAEFIQVSRTHNTVFGDSV